MTTWSSFEKDKLLKERWYSFLNEEQQIIFGLNSKDNEDSLINILNKLAGGLTPDQTISIVNLIADAASDEGVMLEAVALQGSKSERDRVFSGPTTREILQGIARLELEPEKMKAVVKALNYWGRVNTVKFEKPAATTSNAPVGMPDEPTADVPEDSDEPTADVPEDSDEPTADVPEDSDEEEKELNKIISNAKEEFDKLDDEQKQKIKSDIEALTTIDIPDKEGLAGFVQNPFMLFPFIGFNGFNAVRRLISLKQKGALSTKNMLKIGTQFVFDNTDSFLFDVLPDNSLYLLKQGQFTELAKSLGANVSSKGLRFLNSAESGCTNCKKIIKGSSIISKIPVVGTLIVGLATALSAIFCPIASLAGILKPLIASGSLEGLKNDPFYTAGLLGKKASFKKLNNNKKMSIVVGEKELGEIPLERIEAVVGGLQKAISEDKIENPKDAQHYIYGLKSFKAISDGLSKVDRDSLPDVPTPEPEVEPEEADTEPITPVEPSALQESKQMIRWKQLAGIL